MASRKQAVRISTPSVEELQALFDLDIRPVQITECSAAGQSLLYEHQNLIIAGLNILYDAESVGSARALQFIVECLGASPGGDFDYYWDKLFSRAEFLCACALKNSPRAKEDLRMMAETLIQGVGTLSAEYKGYVAANWE